MTDHSQRAVDLVRGRPASAAQARALGQAARFAMLDARWNDAIEIGRQAERMAAELGLDAIRADALATLGTARDDFGEAGGDADLELAIELAEAASAPLPLSRALNNLAWRYSGVDMRRTYELQQRNYETMRRYGHVGQTWWARGQLAGSAFELGRWDEALEHAEAVLAYVEAGTPHYYESGSRLSRAAIAYARGDDSTFAEDIDRSLELAEKATDPQATAPVVAGAAGLRVWAGDLPGARTLLDSALETARATEIGIKIIEYDVALVAAMLDLGREQLGVPPVAPLDARSRAAAALYERDLIGAADTLVELGAASTEAYLRLRAGERVLGEGRIEEAVEQLERALAFYRGVRATRFIARAETLLAGAEQRSA